MFKKHIIFFCLFISLLSYNVCFAVENYLSDDPNQEETQDDSQDNGPRLAFQENQAIDRAQQEFEDELQRLQASNASSGTNPEDPTQESPQNVAQKAHSQEDENLKKYQSEQRQYEVSRTW